MDSERVVQNRVIRFFRGYLDYNDLGDLRHQENKNIIKARLKAFLTEKMKYGKNIVSQTFFALGKLTEPAKGKLDEANREFYQRLKYGFKFSETPEDAPQTVYLVDFEHPENNEFAIAEEVTVKGTQEKRPDLVIYLNGIAVAVIELKASRISVEDGVRQNLTNQKDSFIGSFFATVHSALRRTSRRGFATARWERRRSIISNGRATATKSRKRSGTRRTSASRSGTQSLRRNTRRRFTRNWRISSTRSDSST